MSDTVVLSNYPLSKPYRARLEGVLGGAPSYRVLGELRQAGMAALIRQLWAIRAERLCVAFEDPSTRALLPVMRILAALTRAGRFEVVDESLDVQRFGRVSALGASILLVWESVLAACSVACAKVELARLQREPRQPARAGGPRRVGYLNCNLWFGVKAGGSVGHISGVVNALADLGYEVEFFTVGGRLMVDERARLRALAAPQMLAMPFEAALFAFGRR